MLNIYDCVAYVPHKLPKKSRARSVDGPWMGTRSYLAEKLTVTAYERFIFSFRFLQNEAYGNLAETKRNNETKW